MNTTEKFQKSLKNLKTQEAQPGEFQFGISHPSLSHVYGEIWPHMFVVQNGQPDLRAETGAAMYYRLREWVYVDREVRSEK